MNVRTRNMRTGSVASGLALTLATMAAPLVAQQSPPASIEVPLSVEDGRLVVTVASAGGSSHRFVLGLGMTFLTESTVHALGDGIASLTLAGVPVQTDQAQTVPDSFPGLAGAAGILGGATLNRYDVLIDAPGGRLVLQPVGRTVRWDGVTLSNPVPLQVFHEVLLRADVEFGGQLVGGLLDLTAPHLEVNAPLSGQVSDGEVEQFRMGYGSWSGLPARVADTPTLRGWAGPDQGFVVVGAAVTRDCAIAISWAHAELRTCLR